MEEKKKISFSVTISEYKIIAAAAEAKGMKPSGFCKRNTFTEITMHPPKGVFIEMARQQEQFRKT
jgi:hypothetical protein